VKAKAEKIGKLIKHTTCALPRFTANLMQLLGPTLFAFSKETHDLWTSTLPKPEALSVMRNAS
jgi:hypothetical protein